MFRALSMALLSGLAAVAVPAAPGWAQTGKIELVVTDEDTGEPLAVRLHLTDPQGRPVQPRGVPAWHDHFVFDGAITLTLRPGQYTFVMERGPEYRVRTGHWIIERNADDTKHVTMQRFVDMKQEGWWSGELHVHRPVEQIELLMRAEDLHVAPVITWWNDENRWRDEPLPEPTVRALPDDRYVDRMAGEDERGGGALLYFGLPEPLPVEGAEREFPSPVAFLQQARRAAGAHVDIEKPFWWDVPVWIASGMVDSIGLAHNHMWRHGVLDNEAWGKSRDPTFYPGAHGNGRWTQTIYYHLLNCGIRLPPSAGSASGVLPNPVGYNRVYVHCGDQLDHDAWWEGLRAGRVVVTNGPLLRPRVNGQLPGHVFRAAAGEQVTLSITLDLSLRDPVEYLEVVQDGLVVHEVRLDQYAREGGQLPPVVFDRSGWMLVRVVSTEPSTYRFASSGPYYVEIGGEQRISRESAQFFLDWVHERARRLELDDPEQRASVLRYHRAARDFWQQLLDSANAP